jgi:hypothetical protein
MPCVLMRTDCNVYQNSSTTKHVEKWSLCRVLRVCVTARCCCWECSVANDYHVQTMLHGRWAYIGQAPRVKLENTIRFNSLRTNCIYQLASIFFRTFQWNDNITFANPCSTAQLDIVRLGCRRQMASTLRFWALYWQSWSLIWSDIHLILTFAFRVLGLFNFNFTLVPI